MVWNYIYALFIQLCKTVYANAQALEKDIAIFNSLTYNALISFWFPLMLFNYGRNNKEREILAPISTDYFFLLPHYNVSYTENVSVILLYLTFTDKRSEHFKLPYKVVSWESLR